MGKNKKKKKAEVDVLKPDVCYQVRDSELVVIGEYDTLDEAKENAESILKDGVDTELAIYEYKQILRVEQQMNAVFLDV